MLMMRRFQISNQFFRTSKTFSFSNTQRPEIHKGTKERTFYLIMPPYEITLVTRPLAKMDLVDVLHRAASLFLDKGAVITKLESLGHRDLPLRARTKQSKEHVFASNQFLVHCHMSIQTMNETRTTLFNDLDMIRIGVVNCHHKEPVPADCKLEELLKPPAYRQSVDDLRTKQKLGHYSRQRIFKKTEREWKAIPKAYPIAPARR